MIMDRVEINGVWYVREDLAPAKKPVNEFKFVDNQEYMSRNVAHTERLTYEDEDYLLELDGLVTKKLGVLSMISLKIEDKEAKIVELQKKLDAYPKPSQDQTIDIGFGGGRFNIGNNLKEREYEKEYFDMKGKELKTMVDNVVSSNPDKYAVKISKAGGGYPVYNLINKEKQAEMKAKLANAKTPKEKEAIKKKYEPLINSTISDPRTAYYGGGKFKNRVSNAQGATQMGPIKLERFLDGKPYEGDHNKLGVRAKPTTGNNNFFGSFGSAIEGGFKAATKATERLTKPLAKPVTSTLKAITKQGDVLTSLAKGDIKGAAKAGLDVVNLGKEALIDTAQTGISTATAPTRLIGEATGIKPLKEVSSNIEREAKKGTETYGSAAIDIGANVATGGGYGAGISLARGVAEDGIGSLVSPEKILEYGTGAAASYAGVDPALLKAGIGATKGDLKGAILEGAGSLGGFDPEMLKAGLEGDITGAGLAFAGVDEKTGKALLRGDLADAAGAGLTAGLTGAAAMYGGEMASEAGIDPETFQKAVEISNSALKGDLRQQALQKLSETAGLTPEQSELLTSVTTGNLKDELTTKAGQAAGLTKEQIQLGTSIASGDTKGTARMASEYVIKKGDSLDKIAKKLGIDPNELAKLNKIKDKNKISAGAKLILPQKVQTAVTGATTAADKFMKDAQGRTIYGRNNAPILNPNYEEALADAKQLQKIQDYTPAAGETVQQYADRMGLDPNVILEQNKGKGLSLGKPIPRNIDITLPKGFQLPTKEEPGFFERMGDKISGAWESVTGGDKKAPAKGKEDKGFLDTVREGAGKVGDFLGDNKGIISGVAQGGAAYLGYKAGEEARDEAKKLAKQQLADLQAQGKQFMDITFDPERYKQERKFLQDRIAGQGYTAEEKKMQQEGDIRAARAAAAQRLAGMETQARLGGTALGTAQLAAALSGAQGSQNIQAETNLAREASAQEKMEKALQRQGGLSTQETQERADLARQQGTFGLERTQAVGGVRGELGNLAYDKAGALQRLYGTGADLVTKGLNSIEVSQPTQPQQPAVTPPPPPAQDLKAKAGAAQTISNRRVTSQPTREKPKPAAQQFNAQNIPKYLEKPETAVEDVKQIGLQKLEEEKKKLLNKGSEIVKEITPKEWKMPKMPWEE